jgi:hypothetical protein
VAAEYEASGLSQELFGGQRDIPLKTLARYVVRDRKQFWGRGIFCRWSGRRGRWVSGLF